MTTYLDNETMPKVLAPQKQSSESNDHLVRRLEDCERMIRIYEHRLSVLEQNAIIDNSLVRMLRNALVNADNDTQKIYEKESLTVLFDNQEFMQIMQKAIDQGFCKQVGWQYKWTKKCEAAYFASIASQQFGLSNRKDHDGDIAISWKPFERLFGLNDLRLTFNDYLSCKTTIKRKTAIDKLFK